MYCACSVKISFIAFYFCFNETFLLIFERIFLLSLGKYTKKYQFVPVFRNYFVYLPA